MSFSVSNLASFNSNDKNIYLMDYIRNQGLTGSLLYCVDAADPKSYQGAQNLLDVSGNGNHFVLGTTSGAEGSDPVPTGVIGDATENCYIEANANGDVITNAVNGSPSTQTFNRSGAKWTVAGVYFVPSSAGQVGCYLLCTYNTGSGKGCFVFASSSEGFSAITYHRDNFNTVDTFPFAGTKTSLTKNSWNFIAFSIDEAARAFTVYINGTTNTYTINAMSESNAFTNVNTIMGTTPGGDSLGVRFAVNACWSGINLSTAQLDAMRTEMKKRFPSLP